MLNTIESFLINDSASSMFTKKMKILLVSPFLDNLGGTELESINTANAFSEFNSVSEVQLFVHGCISDELINKIEVNPKVHFFKYPSFLQLDLLKKIDKKISKFMNLEFSILECIYWFFYLRIFKIKKIYILTKSTSNYYLPIIISFNKKNIILKYTTVFYENFSSFKKKLLCKVLFNVVTSNKQKKFFKNEINLPNTINQEVIILNELKAIKYINNPLEKKFDFGIISRISCEKQIEHMIFFIEELKKKYNKVNMFIMGTGNSEYVKKIKNEITNRELNDNITFIEQEVHPNKVFEYLKSCKYSLITSKYEGGPNSALELMALGIPFLSYKVGAMEDRLIENSELLVDDLEELIYKGEQLINLNNDEYTIASTRLKKYYVEHFSNYNKLKFLNEFIDS